MIAQLVLDHAKRGIERPVVGLKLHRAVQEGGGIGGAAALRQHLAVFAQDARIVGRHQHELAERARGAVEIAFGPQQLRAADFAVEIVGQILGRGDIVGGILGGLFGGGTGQRDRRRTGLSCSR